MRAIERVGWPVIRRIVVAGYVVVLLLIVLTKGVPTGRQTIAIMVMAGLAISTIGKGWRRTGQVILDWLPFTLVLMAYDRTRGVADTLGMPLHETDVLAWEKWLCFGQVPTVWLQEHLYNPDRVYWYDALFTLVYTTHFFATPVLAAVLWLRDRPQWVRFISRVLLLSVAGLTTYILFPEAPPWMASAHGHIAEHVARLSARGWVWLHASNVQTALDHAQQAGANPVAAMPSLHAAFAALVAIFLITRLRTRWRWLLVLYPLAMGFTLVYQGEHYVVDLIFGYLYAIGCHLAMNRWERRRAERKRAAAAEAGSAEPAATPPVPASTA